MDEPQPDEPVRLYCGKAYPLGSERCPNCQAPAHIRPHDRTRRFRVFYSTGLGLRRADPVAAALN